MTSDEMEDKYPHWKDALFGNHNAVANVRCAIHYVFWHGVYGILAVLGVLLFGAVSVAKTLATYLGPAGKPIVRVLDALWSKIHYVLNHETTQAILEWALIIAMIGSLIGAACALIYAAITHFWMFVQAVGMVIAGLVIIIALFVVADIILPKLFDGTASVMNYTASKARSAGEKATKTPGIRRVYGECPVSMDMAPKWFDDLFPEEEY